MAYGPHYIYITMLCTSQVQAEKGRARLQGDPGAVAWRGLVEKRWRVGGVRTFCGRGRNKAAGRAGLNAGTGDEKVVGGHKASRGHRYILR